MSDANRKPPMNAAESEYQRLPTPLLPFGRSAAFSFFHLFSCSYAHLLYFPPAAENRGERI